MTNKLESITVYSKPNCPWCSLIVHVLDVSGLKYNEDKIENREEAKYFMKSIQDSYDTKHSTYPLVFANYADQSEFIGGCTEAIAWLKQRNYKTSLI